MRKSMLRKLLALVAILHQGAIIHQLEATLLEELLVTGLRYSRMPPYLLPLVVTSIRTRIEEGFWLKSERSGLLAAAIGCLTLALSTSPSPAQIRNMLCDEVSSGHIETEKKFGVLSTLFEYLKQSSCLTICLEALQTRENATNTSTVSDVYAKMCIIFIPLLVDEDWNIKLHDEIELVEGYILI
ncbi:uncharacterized protein LOC106762274 isoform X9 [Vigna radiata var. radiata]|uniref:Uncharacterized protein LOC106762274 isoform X9 n=1 Tax=Vigna radiata var. radiata TaxID=3916 RepID=A0A3Q0EYN9_VIGRR|nr:uncharacterized protein LOC106762274 isoform X9 [Vigna radiata var. radiata]